MRLSQMIRIYCAANNVSQKALSEQWGIGESTMTRFLANEQMPNGQAVARIIAWLFEESGSVKGTTT